MGLLGSEEGVVVKLSVILLLLGGAVRAACAAEVAQVGRTSVVTEVDAYYSSIGLYYHPTDEPLPYVGSDSEAVIYRDLFLRSYLP